MSTLKVLAGIGILSLLTIIGAMTFADKEPIIVDEKYSENCNVDLTLKYDYNNIQAAHTDVPYSTQNNIVTLYNSRIENFHGSSMQPTIFTQNKLITKDFSGDRNELKEGMIIGYKEGDLIIVHRIKSLYDEYILIQGDNNDYDETINYDDITYIVSGVLYQ